MQRVGKSVRVIGYNNARPLKIQMISTRDFGERIEHALNGQHNDFEKMIQSVQESVQTSLNLKVEQILLNDFVEALAFTKVKFHLQR